MKLRMVTEFHQNTDLAEVLHMAGIVIAAARLLSSAQEAAALQAVADVSLRSPHRAVASCRPLVIVILNIVRIRIDAKRAQRR
jgi:hypothetical protein